MTGWELPKAAEIGGRQYAINADYRDVLDIIAYLNAGEEDERSRLYVALALFYEAFDQMESADHPQALEWMFCFINGGEKETSNCPPAKTIDWEQDRGMIVADINRVAGCEVRALLFCHWWTFLSWFKSIGEGQLATVVAIREKRRKGKKLDDWEREFYQEHRDVVDFKQRYTAEEREEQARLKELLGE